MKNIAAFRDSVCSWDEMSSFNEARAREVMIEAGARAAHQWRHQKILTRVYPKVIC